MVLLVLLNQPGSINRAILRKINVDVSAFRQRIQSMLADWHSVVSGQEVHQQFISERVALLLENAKKEAEHLEDPQVDVQHVF